MLTPQIFKCKWTLYLNSAMAVGLIWIDGWIWRLDFVAFIIVQSYDVCKWSSTLWPDGGNCLFPHYITSLSSLCRCIWKHWTYIMLFMYILSIVYLRLSQFSQLSFIQYMWLCVFSLPISLMMIVKLHVLYLNIILKLEVWPISNTTRLAR